MNGNRNDDEFMTMLKDAFPSEIFQPDDRARRQLRDALANDNLERIEVAPARSMRRGRLGPRASAFTLSAIGVLTFGGVAAAAVATNTLPGPLRAFAYDIGLPVTSPALYQARQQLHHLVSANAHDPAVVARHVGRGLLHDLTLLDRNDLSAIRTPAQKALTQSGLLTQASTILGITLPTTNATVAPSSSTSTTTTTVPLLPIIPGVGSIIGGSTGIGGAVTTTTPSVNSILP